MTDPARPPQRTAALKRLGDALVAWRLAEISTQQFAAIWRSALIEGAFSDRAKAISESLLLRVESSSAFAGESCTLSRDNADTETGAAFALLFEKLKTAQ